jgi:cytokinesis protein
MDELAKPSEANRVNFLDMQSVSKKMLEDIRGIRQSLQTYFADVADGYSRKMFRFGAVAEEELQEVRDGILPRKLTRFASDGLASSSIKPST